MKRFLSIAVLAAAVLFPLGVFAAGQGRIDFKMTHKCEKPVNGMCNSAGEIGIVSTGSDEIEPIAFSGKFTPSSKEVKITNVEVLDGWKVSKDEITGKYTFTPTKTNKAKEFKVAKITTEYATDLKEDCSVLFESDTMGEIKIDVDTEVETNPGTGSFLPVALFAGSLAVVGVAYAGTKKNKKLHNI